MSALLAALKKAAEEKNKRQQRTPAQLTSPQLDSQPIEETLKIDFAEGIETSLPNLSQTSDHQSDSSESVHLNFVDETLNGQISSSSYDSQEENSSFDESKLSSEADSDSGNDSESELTMEDARDEIDSERLTEASEPLSEDISLALDREQLSISEEAKNTENADDEQATTPMSTGDSIDSTSFKMVEEVTDNGSDKRQRLDLETSLALNDETESVPSSIEDAQVSSQQKQSDEDRQGGSADTELAQEDDWSLENIPGYQHNENPSSQRNMQRFIHAIQPKGGLKRHLSIKHWMWVPLILISLGYFGLVMYERESARMVTDLKPFQLQATLPVTSQPESKHKSSVIAKEQVGQSELKKQDSILGKTPTSELDVSAVSPKQPEQPPKQPEQKAPLASLIKEKKLLYQLNRRK